MKLVLRGTTVSLLLAAACAGSVLAESGNGQGGQIISAADTLPNKIHHRMNDGQATVDAPTAGTVGVQTPAITWHGGPVMIGSPNVHLIWYGNWAQANGSDNAAGQQIVRDFFATVSGSPYLAINQNYTGSNGQVTGLIGQTFEATVGYSNGTRLKDANITTIVSNYITSTGRKDANAVYFVLTSSDVAETSGFCTRYCGWHTSSTIAATNIKYSFVGNANRCLSGCAPQTVSPNGNAGVDGMVSVLAHELVETLSDPLLNAWYDSSGAENADKCAWTFGGAQTLNANGSYSNMTLGARKFLVQRNLAIDSKCYVDGVSGQQ
jgi:hypothetical protein